MASEIARVSANLNFDMLGSPNFVRFVYDGDGSQFGLVGPTKGDISSAEIERVFVEFLASKGLQSEPTAFSGRSDYGPFIAVGIPASRATRAITSRATPTTTTATRCSGSSRRRRRTPCRTSQSARTALPRHARRTAR